MDIKPNHLLYLAAVDEHGSLVRAARSLNISQPALSIAIQRLEDITQRPLVERGRNGARLTPAGELLARRGAEIDISVSSAVEEISLLSRGISGRLRVGGTPLTTNSIIPVVIGRILEITTDVVITVLESIDEDLLEKLESNELDVVIGAPTSGENGPSITSVPLFNARTVLVTRPHHPLRTRRQVSLSDLNDLAWAIPPHGGAFRKQIEAFFTTNGVPFPTRIIEASSIQILRRIIETSDAVTLASAQIVQDELTLGKLSYLELTEPLAERVFGLYTKANRELGSLGNLFCEIAIQCAPEFEMALEVETVRKPTGTSV